MLVVGLDGCRSGWAAVSLDEGRFADAALLARASEAVELWPDLTVLAIDIPIGLPGRDVPYPRAADLGWSATEVCDCESSCLVPRAAC